MITFSRLGNYGRLGNQLFQYAAVRAVSKKTNIPLHLPDLTKASWHGQMCLLDEFNIKYNPLISKPDASWNYFSETGKGSNVAYNPKVFLAKEKTDFWGFFQNRKYFEDIKDIIKDDFSLSPEVQQEAQEILKQFDNPTSIHLRLGDYRTGNHGVPGWESLVIEYIEYAKKVSGETNEFLVFTGGSRQGNNDRDSDFNWCKERLSASNVHFMEGNSELLDFELIKQCKNNILGWDSTFSWWASYLNEQRGKIICTDKSQILPLYNDMSEWTKI